MHYSAIIFDCDGTLADTMPAHYEAWVTSLAAYNVPFDEDEFYAMGGWPTLQVADHVLTRAGLPIDRHQLLVEKESLFGTGCSTFSRFIRSSMWPAHIGAAYRWGSRRAG